MKKYISILALTTTLLSSSLQITANASGDLISFGSWHSEVPKIQQTLSNKGYFKHDVTGYFGSITKNAVMNFNNAQFEKSFGKLSQLEASDLTEYCFSGRSNVGKSSLINKVLGRKSIARVSSKPGKTVTINFYKVDNIRLCLFRSLYP